MTKLGYIVSLLLFCSLLIYVAFPEGSDGSEKWRIFNKQHKDFEASVGDRSWLLADGQLSVQTADGWSFDRGMNNGAINEFWKFVIRVLNNDITEAGIRENISAADIAAYGIDGKHFLRAGSRGIEPQEMHWGSQQGVGYLWWRNEQRLLVCPVGVVRLLTEKLQRLDSRHFMKEKIRYSELVCRYPDGDPIYLSYNDSVWGHIGPIERPPCNGRVDDLTSILSGMQVHDLDAVVGPLSWPIATISFLKHEAGQAAETVEEITVYRSETSGWLSNTSGLAQHVDLRSVDEVLARIDALAGDALISIPDTLNGSPIGRIHIQRKIQQKNGAETESFHLYKTGIDDELVGGSRWELDWQQGRTRARADSSEFIRQGLRAIRVESSQRRTGPWREPDNTLLSIELDGDEMDNRVHVAFTDDNKMITDDWEGVIVAHNNDIKEMDASLCLDPDILPVHHERLIKMQRIRYPHVTESGVTDGRVYVREEGRPWRQVYPDAASVQPFAVEQVVHALVSTRVQSVRFATDADKAILVNPHYGIDVRIAPLGRVEGEDVFSIEQTFQRDWGVVLAPEGDGWRAVDRDGDIAFFLTAAQKEQWFGSVHEAIVLPLVPSQVLGVEFYTADEEFSLSVEGEEWSLNDANSSQPAVKSVVRRFIRLLSELRYLEQVDVLQVLTKDEVEQRLIIHLPMIDGEERLLHAKIGMKNNNHIVTVQNSRSDGKGSLLAACRIAETDWHALIRGSVSFLPVQTNVVEEVPAVSVSE